MKKRMLVFTGLIRKSGRLFSEKMTHYTDYECLMTDYKDVVVLIKDGIVSIRLVSGEDIASFDVLFLRDISSPELRHVLAIYAEHHHIPVVNSESGIFQYMSKIEQYVKLALAGLRVPDCFYTTSPKNYIQAYHKLGSEFPFVAKSVTGSNGRDNELIRSVDELAQCLVPNAVIQPFIPNDFDYRIVVAGDHVVLSYKRIRKVDTPDNYKNNIARGGEREFCTVSKDIEDMAVRAANLINREFVGLDIVVNSHTQDPYLLELNYSFGTPTIDDSELENEYYLKVAEYVDTLLT